MHQHLLNNHAKQLIACVYVELFLERGGLSPSRDNRHFISFHFMVQQVQIKTKIQILSIILKGTMFQLQIVDYFCTLQLLKENADLSRTSVTLKQAIHKYHSVVLHVCPSKDLPNIDELGKPPPRIVAVSPRAQSGRQQEARHSNQKSGRCILI